MKVTPELVASIKAHNKCLKLLKAIRADGDDAKDVAAVVADDVDINRPMEGKSFLEWAIHLGKFERFKTLCMNSQADLNATVKVGTSQTEMSLLHYAAAKGLTRFVKYLAEEIKMDTNLPDKHERGLLPIHHAARSGKCKTLDALNKNQEALTAVTLKGDFCIHIAAMLGQLDMVKHLLTLKASANCRNSEQRTPLHCAIFRNQIETVTFFLRQKNLRNDVDFQGRNAYLLAVEAGAIDLVKLLVLPGDKFTESDYNGFGALHIAAQKNNVKMMCFIKSCDPLTFVASDNAGRLPIHIAVEHDAAEAFDFYITELQNEIRSSLANRYPANALDNAVISEIHDILNNWQDVKGDTVIEYALRFKARNIINKLMALRVKFDRTNKSGRTTFEEMIEQDNADMASFLIDQGVVWTRPNQAGLTPIQLALQQGKILILELFREKIKFDFCASDSDGMLPIHWACLFGNQTAMDWLIQYNFGALTSADNKGRNCLFHAARGDRDELIAHLVSIKKMSLSALCSNGFTVMHHAIFKSAAKAALMLNKLGVSFEVRGKNGLMPLHLACRSGLITMVDFLVAQKVNCDARDASGRNVWYYAVAVANCEEIFSTLEKHQVPLQGLLDNDSMSPLHQAAGAGNLNAVKYLLSKGIDGAAQNRFKETPLDRAAKFRKKHQAELQQKIKNPEYGNGKNPQLNEELEQLKSKVDSCLKVEDYLHWVLKPVSTDKVNDTEKRERANQAEDVPIRIVKPKLAILPPDEPSDNQSRPGLK